MTDLSTLICIFCKHLHDDGARCAAFPEGIQDDTIFGGHDHHIPFEGDGGILFELKPGEETNWDEWQDLSEALSQSCEIRINSKYNLAPRSDLLIIHSLCLIKIPIIDRLLAF